MSIKVVVTIKGKEVSLSPKEAKELYRELFSLFPETFGLSLSKPKPEWFGLSKEVPIINHKEKIAEQLNLGNGIEGIDYSRRNK